MNRRNGPFNPPNFDVPLYAPLSQVAFGPTRLETGLAAPPGVVYQMSNEVLYATEGWPQLQSIDYGYRTGVLV